jgi:omega-6 fatty acid desaturase (delta-12 desaturase)
VNAAKQPEQQAKTNAWKEVVAKYQTPSRGRSAWQLVNTLGSYIAVWALMYWSLAISYWLTVPLVIVAGGLMVRAFIIFHDCGHGSFYRSRKANDFWGMITGVLTFSPYYLWRWEHAIHHASSGDLDRRGTGDVWTLTVQEYLQASRWEKFSYRLARNPIVLFGIAPLVLFLVIHRLPAKKAGKRENWSVLYTNLGILLIGTALSLLFGLKTYLVLQIAVMAIAGSAGVWMFYIQHQFEGVYWERGKDWDYATAALQGSSFYRLPKILQWFTGNIGFHHIHHLSPAIPNYRLEKAHEAEPLFQTVKPVTLLSSLKSFTFRLWDEQRRRLVSFGHLRKISRTPGA